MNYIFGPVASRRFGLSLGIDLSPKEKSCNFDCLYCELSPAKPIQKQREVPKVGDIVAQVQEALHKYPQIEVLTITSNGEPTLYPYLDELVDSLNHLKKDKKLLILSNGSTIDQENIQKSLCKIDIVKLSLDCATTRCFKRLDRPHKTILLERIILGMEAFRQVYKGFFVIEILVVAGINDKEEEFIALNQTLQKIAPDRIDIGTIDRPPAYKVGPVSYERLFELSKLIKNLPVAIVAKKEQGNNLFHLKDEEIFALLHHRPLSQKDLHLFDAKTQERFKKLFEEGLITTQKVGKVSFYKSNR